MLALQVSQMSLRDMDTVFMKGRGFDEQFVKSAIKELLEAITFLYTEVQAVHTGRQPTFLSSCMCACLKAMLTKNKYRCASR